MTHSQGLFALIVGEGSNSGASGLGVKEVFKNNGTLVGASCSYTPSSGDTRRLRISFNDGTGFVTIPTDQTIRSVPYALNSNLLQGLTKDAFLQAKTAGDQTKIDNLILKFQALIDLANGNSSNYVTTSQIPINSGIIDMTGGGVNVPQVPSNINSAVSKFYSDTTVAGRAVDVSTLANGQSLVWNTTLNTWKAVTSTSGTVTSIVAGIGLSGGTITSTGTIGLATTGVAAGTYTKLSVDSYGRALSGGVLVSSDIPSLDWSKISSGKPLSLAGYGIIDGVRNGGNVDSLQSGTEANRPAPGNAGKIFFSTDTQKIYIDNGSAWTVVSSANGAGGTLTSITAGAGLTGGTITTNGTVALATSGVTAGTYSKVTVDTYGRATAGGVLLESDIPSITGVGKISASSINSGTMTGSASLNVTGTIKTSSSVSSTSLVLTDTISGNTVTLSAPQNLTTDYNFIFPLGKGTSGQLLTTDGQGNLSWTSVSGGGSTPDATTSTKGLVLLAAPGSTSSGVVIQASDARLSDSRTPSGTASGDLSGSYPAPTVVKLQGTSVSSTPGVSGQTLVHDGSQWAANFITASQIKNNLGLSQFPNNCTPAQTMTYSVMLAQYICSDIAITASNITGLIASSGNATSTQIVLGNDSRLTDSRTPSGSASGDLTGSYPGPTLTATGVSSGIYTKVQVDTKGRVLAGALLTASDLPALDWSKITTGIPTTLTGHGITDGVKNAGGVPSIQSGLEASRPAFGTAGRIYIATDTMKIYHDTGIAWSAVATANGAGGTVTSVTAGSGLTGGTVTSTGTLAVDTGTTANKIVALDSNAKLPAIDGSQLTNLNSLSGAMIVYDTAGTTSWTVPAGVKKVFVEVWGAGGGGSGGKLNGAGANGGGAGAYQSWYQTVVPGTPMSLKVGAGGLGGSGGANAANGTSGGDGEDSSFGGTSVAGGLGGTNASVGTGGVATTGAAMNGMSGGPGSVGGINSVLTGLIFSGVGGQGGGAPKGGAGGAGSGGTYSTAAIGVAPGGGGGGGGGQALVVPIGLGSNGGIGGKGRVVIWW